MNQKTTYLILAAVVVAAVAVWMSKPSEQPEKPGEGTGGKPEPRKLFDPPPSAIASLEADVPGRMSIAATKETDKWRLTSPINAPGNGAVLESIASQVRDMSYVASFKPGAADRPSDELTGLSKPIRLKLTATDGKSFVVKLGNSVPAARQTYVQRDGDDTIYIASGDLRPTFDRPFNDFRNSRIVDFPIDEAKSIEVYGEESYKLARSGDAWTIEAPVRGRADKTAVESLLRAFAGLFVSNFVEDDPKNLAAYGLASPSARLVVHCEKRTLKPGTQPADTQPAEPEYDVKPYTVALALGATTGVKRFGRLDDDSTPWVFQLQDASVKTLLVPLFNLRDKAVARVETGRVGSFSVTCRGHTAELMRRDGVWQFASGGPPGIEPTAIEFAAIDEFLRTVRDLVATGVEPPDALADYGFESPRSSIQLTLEGTPEPVRLEVGKETPSGTGVYVRNVGEGLVAVVKAESAEGLVVGPMHFVSRDLARFDRARASKIELERDGRTLEVRSVAGQWRLAAPIDGQTESGAVNNLLADLATLRARRVVGGAEDVAVFGIDRPAARVRVTVDPPPPPPKPVTTQTTQEAAEPTEPPPPPSIYTILVSRVDGKVYAHLDGSKVIGEVDTRVLENLTAELLERRVLPVQGGLVESVRIARVGELPFEFEKKGDEWELVGESSFDSDANKVSPVASAVMDLKTTRYVDYQTSDMAKYGLDRPAVGVTLRMNDGQTHELRVSASGPPGDTSGARYGTIVGSGRVFVVSRDDLAKFDKDVKSFRKG